MTNIQKPSPALSPRSVLCGRLFPFIPCSFSGALLRAATSDSAPDIRLCGQTFFLFFALPFTDTASIDLRARHDEYSKALARTLASFRPLRTTFFFYTLFFLRCATSRCDFRLCALYSSLRTDFFPSLRYALCRYGQYRSAARFSRVGRSRYA